MIITSLAILVALQRANPLFLALEEDAVVGIMPIYDGSIVQLRGERAAVQFMLDNLTLESVGLQVPSGCESLLVQKYPRFEMKANVTLMSLELGLQRLSFKVEPERLKAG